MDPTFAIAALAWVTTNAAQGVPLQWCLGSIIAGILGTEGHRFYREKRSQIVKSLMPLTAPQNHDLARAVRTAQIEALERLGMDYRDAHRAGWDTAPATRPTAFLDQLNEMCRDGNSRLVAAAFDQTVTDNLRGAFESLLSDAEPGGASAERTRLIAELAEDTVLDELRATLGTIQLPPDFAAHFRNGVGNRPRFLDLFGAFFSEQIKPDTPVRAIFAARLLTRIESLAYDANEIVWRIEKQFGALLVDIKRDIEAVRRGQEDDRARDSERYTEVIDRLERLLRRMPLANGDPDQIEARLRDKISEYLKLRAELEAERSVNQPIYRYLRDIQSKESSDRLHSLSKLAELRFDELFIQNIDEIITSLINTLSDQIINEYSDLNRALIRTLGHLGLSSAKAVPILTRFLDECEYDLINDAAISLGRIGTFDAVSELVQRIHKGDEILRVASLHALGQLGHWSSPDVVPLLIEALDSGDARLKRTAVYGLGHFGPNATVATSALIRKLDDIDDDIVQYAARSLWLIGEVPDSAVAALTRAIKSPSPDTRKEAFRAISRVTPITRDILSLMVTGLDDDRPGEAHIGAIDALRYIGSKDLRAIADLLSDDCPILRAQAARVLLMLGPMADEAEPALVRAFDDTDPDVRSIAANAVSQIRSRTQIRDANP